MCIVVLISTNKMQKGRFYMATITFNEKGKDKKLFQEIIKYQKEHGFKYPVEAVRKLCEMSLKVQKLTKEEGDLTE